MTKRRDKREERNGAWMCWHGSGALWVLLAWGKPLEQKDRDGWVWAVPPHTCTLKMDHTVFPANKSTGLWPDNPISLNTVLAWSDVSRWLMANHWQGSLNTPVSQRMLRRSDDDLACRVKGMSACRILYKRVRWESCRLGCKCSLGRSRPVCAGELQTCE